MDCPKCTGTLEPKTYGREICIHRCNQCTGLWAKPESISHMKKAWMAEAALDVGNPKLGTKFNHIDEIHCPEGHGLMKKTEDDEQFHIWYEQCQTCEGIFFDAGEFTDLKFTTALDKLRSLIKGHRKTS